MPMQRYQSSDAVLLQTLTEAWKDRMADPWTQKTLKEGPHPSIDNRLPPEQATSSYIGPDMPPELPTVTATTLDALREYTCHKSARQEVWLAPGLIMPCSILMCACHASTICSFLQLSDPIHRPARMRNPAQVTRLHETYLFGLSTCM